MQIKKNIPLIDQHDKNFMYGGKFGGNFIPETLKKPVDDLTRLFAKLRKNKIFINLKSDSEMTEITIEDDGDGYPRDILPKIGEPYLKTSYSEEKSKTGLGLGLFIGKTLLEKNFASLNFRNSKTRSGAEVIISWRNSDLFNI